MSGRRRRLPWLVAGSGVVYFLGAMVPHGKPADPMQIAKAGRFLVVADGRVKPLDTFARVALMVASRRQTYVDEQGKRREAMRWFLNVMGSGTLRSAGAVPDHGPQTSQAAQQGDPEKARIFRIDNDQLQTMLGLERRKGLRYAQDEIINRARPERYRTFLKKALAARDRPEQQRDVTDVKALELLGNLLTQAALMNLDGLMIVPGTSFADWAPLRRALMTGNNAADADALAKILNAYATGDAPTFNREVDAYLAKQAVAYPVESRMARLECWFNAFAPFDHAANLYVAVLLFAVLSWATWPDALRPSAFWLCVVVALVHTFAICLRMYIQGRPPVNNLFSSAVFIGWGCVVLCLWVERRVANGIGVAVAAALGFATMIVAHHLGGSGDTMEVMQAVLDTNFWLATHVTAVTLGYTATFVAGFLAMALIFRMQASTIRAVYLDRKSLTLRETVMFLAAVAGVVGLPAVMVLGISAGLWTLWMDGDNLELGFALVLSLPVLVAAAVCGFLLIVRRLSPEGKPRPLLNLVTRQALTAESSRRLTALIYGTVCFATLLSFVGTVLGGLWADQAWGRFWGWDPKENGALEIVVMNALILHARWGGMIKERGLAVLALVGNMVTAWSWFGTNQLGVGLHAYGFNKALAEGCALFWVFNLILLVLGLSGTSAPPTQGLGKKNRPAKT
jgi:ABC-type transport system involved in cytochrome c biogenesis permease subunit